MSVEEFIPTEHESQVAFFDWWPSYAATRRIPEVLCFAVPNGGHRHKAVAGKLKAEGVKSGTADVFLLVPAHGFHGLIMEFKRKVTGRLRHDQKLFLYYTKRQGYCSLSVWSTDEAMAAVTMYLDGTLKSALTTAVATANNRAS